MDSRSLQLRWGKGVCVDFRVHPALTTTIEYRPMVSPKSEVVNKGCLLIKHMLSLSLLGLKFHIQGKLSAWLTDSQDSREVRRSTNFPTCGPCLKAYHTDERHAAENAAVAERVLNCVVSRALARENLHLHPPPTYERRLAHFHVRLDLGDDGVVREGQ